METQIKTTSNISKLLHRLSKIDCKCPTHMTLRRLPSSCLNNSLFLTSNTFLRTSINASASMFSALLGASICHISRVLLIGLMSLLLVTVCHQFGITVFLTALILLIWLSCYVSTTAKRFPIAGPSLISLATSTCLSYLSVLATNTSLLANLACSSSLMV